MKKKTVCVIGLGYIGLPTAALIARKGFSVSGIDVNKKIVAKQRSFGWYMSEAETKDQKDKVVVSFLKTLFNYTFKP